jgi:hypothetical protein
VTWSVLGFGEPVTVGNLVIASAIPIRRPLLRTLVWHWVGLAAAGDASRYRGAAADLVSADQLRV